MFTVTDEDRKLRKEGQSWKVRCELGLSQDHGANYPTPRGDSREEEILASSLKDILKERTELIRLRYRQDREPNLVSVTISQRAIEEAMAEACMTVMSERNVRRLIYSYISLDFGISTLLINFPGTGRHLTMPGHNYTHFYLSLMEE